MAICEWCGKEFDYEDAESIFCLENCTLSYGNFKKCLCGECALEAVEAEANGIYYEVCEECGRKFDYFKDCSAFDSHFGKYNGTSLSDYWREKILCADCAIEKANQ